MVLGWWDSGWWYHLLPESGSSIPKIGDPNSGRVFQVGRGSPVVVCSSIEFAAPCRELYNRCDISFYDKNVPTDPGFTLTLNQRMSYPEVKLMLWRKGRKKTGVIPPGISAQKWFGGFCKGDIIMAWTRVITTTLQVFIYCVTLDGKSSSTALRNSTSDAPVLQTTTVRVSNPCVYASEPFIFRTTQRNFSQFPIRSTIDGSIRDFIRIGSKTRLESPPMLCYQHVGVSYHLPLWLFLSLYSFSFLFQ